MVDRYLPYDLMYVRYHGYGKLGTNVLPVSGTSSTYCGSTVLSIKKFFRYNYNYFNTTVSDVNAPSHIKGIFQPFELGGETRLIRSTVKY
jgi:hypothetical protein